MPATGASSQRSTVTGKWYDVRLQQKDNSCAAACIRMLSEKLNGTDPGEASVRSFISDAYGQGSALGNGGVIYEPGRDMMLYATEPAKMVTALKGLRPPIDAAFVEDFSGFAGLKGSASVNAKLALITPKNPMIIGVFWEMGGAHVMLGCDRDATSGRIIVADPHYGVKFIEPSGYYEPALGSKATATLAVYRA